MTDGSPTWRAAQRPATWGRGRAVRLPGGPYATDQLIHLTICAAGGQPFLRSDIAQMICLAVERSCESLEYRLYAYCLMPDHLHVLLSPADSETEIGRFLRRFKSFTTRHYQKLTERPRLWQYSARDRVLRRGEDPIRVAAYIANNPVRCGLVECWTEWPYLRVFVE